MILYLCTMKQRHKTHFKSYSKDLQFMYIASTYNMVDEYKTSRRHGRNPYQALYDWDLPLPEKRLASRPSILLAHKPPLSAVESGILCIFIIPPIFYFSIFHFFDISCRWRCFFSF